MWSYNSRHELTEALRYAGDDPNSVDPNDAVTARNREYEYDQIGSRETYTPADEDDVEYTANELNQYTHSEQETAAEPIVATYVHDGDGNLTNAWAAAT